MDTEHFEQWLSELFSGGECRRRELRLSPAQRDYLSAHHGGWRIAPLAGQTGDPTWFEVSF